MAVNLVAGLFMMQSTSGRALLNSVRCEFARDQTEAPAGFRIQSGHLELASCAPVPLSVPWAPTI